MSNTPLNIVGFETADLSEVIGVFVNGSNAIAASNTQSHGGAYSCHIYYQSPSAGTYFALFHLPTLASNGTLKEPNLSTVYLRFYCRLVTVTNSGSWLTPLVSLLNQGSQSSTNEGTLYVTSSRNLQYQDSGGGVHTGTTVLSLNTWYRLDVYLNTSTGAFQVNINNGTELSGTHAGAQVVNLIEMGGTSGASFEYYLDDIWLDSSGFAPDGGVALFTSNNVGNFAHWTGTPSNAVPPSSTGALTDTTTGDVETIIPTYNISSGTVNAVKSLCYVSGGGGESLAAVLYNYTTLDTTSGASVGATYTPLAKVYIQQPSSSSSWNVAGLTNTQPGVENITASGTSSCEAIYILVDYSTPVQSVCVANYGSFVETGESAARGAGILATGGSFVETGKSAALGADYFLSSTYGSYAETGRNAALGFGYYLVSTYGSFAETGKSAARSILFPVSLGTFSKTGEFVILGIAGPAAVATFMEIGSSVTVNITRASSTSIFVETGEIASLLTPKNLTTSAAAFTEVGESAMFSILFQAGFGAFSEIGQSQLWPIIYSYTGSGTITLGGCPVVEVDYLFTIKYAMGAKVYDRISATRGVLEALVVRKAWFVTDPRTAQKKVLYRDGNNCIHNEYDLCSQTEAINLITTYYNNKLTDINRTLAQLNCC